MIEILLLEYKRLLEERRDAILEMDGAKVKNVLQKEEEILSKLEKEISQISSLSPTIRELAKEIYTLHDEVANLTFKMIDILKEELK
jgi:chromosome segregation ATPase